MSNYLRTTPCASVRVPTLVALAALIATCFAPVAQSADFGRVDSAPDLMPVVVTAARIEQSQADALPHTTVISSDTIRNSQAIDLPTLLRREAGLQFTQSGGPGLLTSFFMRGATPSETLVLVDGVPVRRQGFSGSAAIEQIQPEQVDHIEIVRGNVSAIYGSGAIGGVVQIFTKRGKQAPVLDFALEAGSRGTYKVAADIAGSTDSTRYAFSAAHFKTNGFAAMNAQQYPNENRDNHGDENDSVSAMVGHQWGPEHEIGARLYANDARFKYSGGGFGAPSDINRGTSQQQSLALFSRDRFTADWSSTVTLSQTRTNTHDLSISAFGYDARFDSTANLLQWANEVTLSPQWTLNAGADLGREHANAVSDDGFSVTQNAARRSTSSEYAGINGTLGAHQLQLNVRHDQIGGSGAKSTGYLGYGYAFTPVFKLTATASTAFNTPTLAQVYNPVNGNPDLLPETARSVELGAQYAAGATLLRATLFKTRTVNQFGIDPDNCFSGAFPAGCPTFNIARATNTGLELSGSGKLGDADVRSSLTLQRPVNDVTDQVLPLRARRMLALAASQRFGALRLGGDLQFTGERADGTHTLGSYVLANLNARYAVSSNLTLYGRIDNLFDRDYQTVYGYNQAPRGVFVGLNWQQ